MHPDPHSQLALLREELRKANEELASYRLSPKVGLVWEQQSELVEELLTTKIPILKAQPSKAIGDGSGRPHILIEGDNLHALTCLQYTHEERVDVIYIDPPYNRKGAKDDEEDFQYNDNYVGKVDTYRHSKWLSFMDRRLRLAANLLAPGGFIAVQIDDNELAHLRLLMDSLFGEDNVKVIVVKMSETSGKKMGAVKRFGGVAKLKEYVLIAKPGGVKGIHFESVPKLGWDSEYRWYIKNFTKEQRSLLREYGAQTDGVSDSDLEWIDTRILKDIELVPVASMMDEEGVHELGRTTWLQNNSWRIVRTAASSSVLALAKEKRPKVAQGFYSVRSKRDGILYVVKGSYTEAAKSPRVQVLFADENLSKHPGDFWSDISTTGLDAEGGISFKNGKKPLSLLRRIISAHPSNSAVVLDFFAGSGSTGHAVADLNALDGGTRQAILVTNNENSICSSVTYPRLKGILTGMLPNGTSVRPLPGELRYYKCELIARTSSSDAMLRRLRDAAVDLVAIKEGTIYAEQSCTDYVVLRSPKHAVVVWKNWTSKGLLEALKMNERAHTRQSLYLFSANESEYPSDSWPGWELNFLPDALRVAMDKGRKGAKNA